MLYILLFIFILIFIISIFNDSDVAEPAFFFTIVTTLALIGVGITYNNIKTTSTSKLEVLNEQNEIVLAQIEPLVQQALNYESNTYKEFKLNLEFAFNLCFLYFSISCFIIGSSFIENIA